MNASIDLRRLIEQSLQTRWPDFAARHPRLAAVCDQSLLLDALAEHFSDAPDYQHALADAAAANFAAEHLSRLVDSLTARWLARLL